jgi:hypothetical protein
MTDRSGHTVDRVVVEVILGILGGINDQGRVACHPALCVSGLQAFRPSSLQAFKPPSLQAFKPSSLQAFKPPSLQAFEPSSLEAS